MGSVAYEEYKKAGKIKCGCIEMLRSLNLDRSFIILDEAQHLDESTLKIVMNRTGYKSKLVLAGDPAQSDLEGHGQSSGLQEFLKLVKNVKTHLVKVVEFLPEDSVRSPLVRFLLRLYERRDRWRAESLKKKTKVEANAHFAQCSRSLKDPLRERAEKWWRQGEFAYSYDATRRELSGEVSSVPSLVSLVPTSGSRTETFLDHRLLMVSGIFHTCCSGIL